MNPIVEKILDRADDYRCADYEDRWEKRQALRAAIEQALTPGEPVAYQYRMRPTWGSRGANWGPWEECSRGKYEDCKKAPVVNDWEHEARALYTAPQPATPPGYKLVPVEQLYAWRQRINTLAILSSKANRYEAAIALKQSIRDAIDSPEAPQPAKRVPLTDAQIDAISDDHRDWTHQIGAFRNFARAVIAAYERKNGIGGQE
jgi:hypothetical protein